MSEPQYVGIHSGTMTPKKSSKKNKKEYWYMWFIPQQQRYIMKSLNPNSNLEPCFITPLQYGLNFKIEKEVDVPEPPLPDIKGLKYFKQNASPYAPEENAFVKSSNAQEDSQTEASEEEANTPLNSIKSIEHGATQNSDAPNDTLHIKQKTSADGKSLDDVTHIDDILVDLDNLHTEDTSPHAPEALLLPKETKESRLKDKKALRIDHDFRNELNVALDFWKKGKKGVAAIKIEQLFKRKEDFVKAHKHTFTECAIQLRKIRQNDFALSFALRATEIAPDDSHTFFNAARMHYELKNYKKALVFLEKALALDANLKYAVTLQNTINEILKRSLL